MGKNEDRKVASSNMADVEAGSSSTSANSSQENIVKPITTWKGYIWDTWELPKEERWLLFKVDAFVLTFASVTIPFTISSNGLDVVICVSGFAHAIFSLDRLFPQKS